MSGYLVLARKYRSSTFDEVVGQEPIAQTLTNAISAGRVAHAYLFTGTRGVGKTTMARILAKALNCLATDAPTTTPCNKCDACLAIARGDDIDVAEIDGASNRGIEEIRQLRANAIFAPARSRYKIYYIDEVHQITREAFNALLKTLEEPPPHVKFIFATTETEKIPATILSRCQRFDFRNIPTRRIAEHMKSLCKAEGVEVDDDAMFRLARSANGSMRDGLSLLEQLLSGGQKVTDEQVLRVLGVPGEERVASMVGAIAEGDSHKALTELDGLLQGGVALASIVGALGDYFRNLMLAGACGANSDLIELTESQKSALAPLVKKFSTPMLVGAMGILGRLSYNIRGSSLARPLVEAAVIRLAQAEKFIDPQSLVERLRDLAEGGAGVVEKKKPTPMTPRGGDRGFEPRPQPPAPNQHATRQPQGEREDVNNAPTPPDPPRQMRHQLSTAQREEVHNDPAVKEVLTLFEGEIIDIRQHEILPDINEDDQQDKNNEQQ